MLSDLTLLLSAVLLFMSLEAVAVALLRIARLRPSGPGVAGSNRGRRIVLAAFALYLAGACLRETGVLIFGTGPWLDDALVVAVLARALMIAGASLFVGVVTFNPCRHWVWAGTLAAAFAIGFVHMVVT